ncbi:HalOD1 output domain-containing protein [Haloferax namakaokahaiae]|uniref:HalOD1 output domain-containing protein n=1 Tax=Haloferax namakaokahaiae TaxID=1748331 RepID=A0ABD5ZAF6_9EURY
MTRKLNSYAILTERRPAHDDEETLLEQILRCVAVAKNTPPTELPPMYDVIDPDALDSLDSACQNGLCSLTIHYAGFDVHVRSGGRIWLIPRSHGE